VAIIQIIVVNTGSDKASRWVSAEKLAEKNRKLQRKKLPSLLAKDIQKGLQQFLAKGFEASDDFMSGIMVRFVKDPAGWLKGPYLQLGLPFTPGAAGKQSSRISRRSFWVSRTKWALCRAGGHGASLQGFAC